jgi:hypothetical protein
MSTEKTTTKTEPKFEMPTNPFAAFDPMAYWNTSQQSFQKMLVDAYGRAQAFADQYAAMEQQFISRAQTAVSNWAQLTNEALAYGAQLSAEARKIGFETAKRMGVGA